MLFNSFEFYVFLPVIILLYFILPHRFRWILLLAGSYYFYMAWKPKYIILIIISTLIDYFVSLRMEKQENKHKRKTLLLISLLCNLGLLFVFKYFNFINGSISFVYESIFSNEYPIHSLQLLLPVGISFYTFQTLSYTIDVYRGRRKAERHLGYFALYVSFFPQLVAGPIERSERLIPQLKQKHKPDYSKMVDAFLRIIWGLFKKIVIADRLASLVNTVYSDVESFYGIYLIIAAVAFAIQIYCDFSAYSDIAIGSAKLMGIELMENFKMPYFAKSINEHWSRWHISLTTWFRDYLYIPIGGSRTGKEWRNLLNVLIVFLVSGLWHGANWTFIFWGMLHGLYSIFEKQTEDKFLKWIPSAIRRLCTFMLLVVTFVFFRSDSIGQAFSYISHMSFANIGELLSGSSLDIGLDKYDSILAFVVVLLLFVVDGYKYFRNRDRVFNTTFGQGLIAVFLMLFIIVFGYYGSYNPVDFIYFQF